VDSVTQWGLDTLFNPSKRHMDEEKRRLQATREEVGDNSGGERIDVSTGKVVIKRKTDEPSDADEVPGDTESGSPSAKPAKAKANSGDPEPDPSTAAGRAQLRRAAKRKPPST
jgi:hypothetical protein